MLTLRKSHDRGHAEHGWLQSLHSFSFADYHDPDEMGFSVLRVINEDWIAPGAGFPTHPHRDMEIITYVLEGTLAHQDSLGTGSRIQPGDVQRMSAGTGIAHSEFNASSSEPVHLLQIWIVPRQRALPPAYEQKHFPDASLKDNLHLVASPDGADGSITVHQDVRLYAARLEAGTRIDTPRDPARHAYLQVARGELVVNGVPMEAGDGLKVTTESALDIHARNHAEFLLFDLP